MIANTDWSRNDSSNPFSINSDTEVEYTSLCAKYMFKAFHIFCLLVLYIMMVWSVLFIVLCLYAFAHYDQFEALIVQCCHVSNEVTFKHHHLYRISVGMAYGLLTTAFALTATRVSKYTQITKGILTLMAIVISIFCVLGGGQDVLWGLNVDLTLHNCHTDWYIIALYRAWPWYLATLLIFGAFTGVKYIERKYFISRDED